MNKTDEQLFEELHEWLESEGFVIEDVKGSVTVDGDVLVNPTESLTMKWRVVHPKKPKATECYIYEELWDQYEEVSQDPNILDRAKSIFKWMIQFYEING